MFCIIINQFIDTYEVEYLGSRVPISFELLVRLNGISSGCNDVSLDTKQ